MSTTSTPENSAAASVLDTSSGDLFGRTLRTVAVLVGACVVFVGALSAAAVLVTSKAVGPSAHEPSGLQEPASAAPKKPLAI